MYVSQEVIVSNQMTKSLCSPIWGSSLFNCHALIQTSAVNRFVEVCLRSEGCGDLLPRIQLLTITTIIIINGEMVKRVGYEATHFLQYRYSQDLNLWGSASRGSSEVLKSTCLITHNDAEST